MFGLKGGDQPFYVKSNSLNLLYSFDGTQIGFKNYNLALLQHLRK